MKGGLAAIMVATAQAKKLALRGDVILTAVADEEFASIGTQSVLKRWRADAAIVTEPTSLELCIAHKGFAWLEVETRGRAAHGSLPDAGRDAIVMMGHVLVALERLDQTLRSNPSHLLLASGSLHASLIEGGQELSSYPERCLLQIERRTIPGETWEQVEGQIRAIHTQIKATHPTFEATVKTTLVREPFEVAENAPIVRTLFQELQQQFGSEPMMGGSTAWMDAALLSAAGIPTVIFGPGGDGAHAVAEWSDLEQVKRCSEILVAALQTFCG